MDFKVATKGSGNSPNPLKQAILGIKLARYILYVKWGAHCMDLCIFDDKGKPAFSYKDFKNILPGRTEDLSSWGLELFGSGSFSQSIKKKDVTSLPNSHSGTVTPAQHHAAVGTTGGLGGAVTVHADRAYHLTQPAHLASSVVCACQRSPAFFQSFQHFAGRNRTARQPVQCGDSNQPKMSAPIGIVIHLREPCKEYLDYAWDYRVHRLVGKKGVLEDAMSWLNTLGGGYSALGDYFQHHAKEAANVSLRQLQVAVELGDPPTVLRCHLYLGLSLMQRGQLRRAKRIIRHQYHLAKKVASSDTRLQASCHGLWSRLRYLYALRRQPRDIPGLCPSG